MTACHDMVRFVPLRKIKSGLMSPALVRAVLTFAIKAFAASSLSLNAE